MAVINATTTMETYEREKMEGKKINFRKNKELSKAKKLQKQHLNRNGQHKFLYPSYIKSKAWLARRIRFYDAFGRSCAVCGDSNNTSVHHLSYLHLGDEKDNELMVLCRFHHRDYHFHNGVQSNMIKKTHAYVKEKRAETQEKLAGEEA